VCVITGGREIWRVPRRIEGVEFLNRLAGATLRIEAIEEIHPPLRDLSEELQRESPTIYFNAYASWGTSRGLAIHYDYTKILVLQCEGRKHWSIYRPTRAAVRGPESRTYKDALQRAERGEYDDVAELNRVYSGLF